MLIEDNTHHSGRTLTIRKEWLQTNIKEHNQ
jgi:hypothetical protein